MLVESRSAGTPSCCLPAPEPRHAAGAASLSKTERGDERKGNPSAASCEVGPRSPVGSTLP